MTQEVLFDRNLLRLNRERASKNFAQHNFMHHEVANRIAENVEFLNRNFENVLEIGAYDDYLSSLILAGSRHEDEVTNPRSMSPRLHDGVQYDFHADEEVLSVKKSYDLILSNLNFHYINQIPQFLLQIKEALNPNGVFIASFFGEENLSQLAHVLYETENEIYNGVSPRMPPTIDVKTAANLLAKAGFQNPISDFAKIEVEYEDPKNLLKDLKMMGQGNILVKRSRKFFTKEFLEKISKNYRKMYPDGVATFEVVTVTGWKN
jgi:SAM-dependent methyltransferase